MIPATDVAKATFKLLVQKLEDYAELNVDIWGVREAEADIMVHGDQIKDVQIALDNIGLEYKVTTESLGKLIRMEEEEIAMADRSAGFNIGQYHTLDEIYKHLHELAGKQTCYNVW